MATGGNKQPMVRHSSFGKNGLFAVLCVLHEGWCTKESGTHFLGRTNWKKRWFKLAQGEDRSVYLQYYRSKNDKMPVGTVKIDVTYCAREIEDESKPYPNCFTIGPIIDDGATRTYFISCNTKAEMLEWMTAIDAAIQGVPDKASHRMRSATMQYRTKSEAVAESAPKKRDSLLMTRSDSEAALDTSVMHCDRGWLDENPEAKAHLSDLDNEEYISDDDPEPKVESDEEEEFDRIAPTPRRASLSAMITMSPKERLKCYADPTWRLQRWYELCTVASTASWNKVDRKDGITISRCKFGRNPSAHAVIKVEGVLPAEPDTVYQFLQLSTKQGGKLDYIFRNETILQNYEADPVAEIVQNQFAMPLPRISVREAVAMKIWIPEFLSTDSKSGFVMVSVEHPKETPLSKGSIGIHINPSGFILSAFPGPDDDSIFTNASIIVQLSLKSGLHQMTKGAYNSGLLKLGLRTTFNHIRQQLRRFMDVTQISSVSSAKLSSVH